MKAKVKNFEVDVQPMTKFDYNDQILKMKIQHTENKRIDGFYCNWNGYKYWIDKDVFNKLYILENDKEI